MIAISMKSKYGLAAALELALAYGHQPLRAKQIAEIQSIPHKFLEAVLLQLKQGHIVSSFRGVNGGYQLARDPQSITVFDVLTVLEGPSNIAQFEGKSDALKQFWIQTDQNITNNLKTPLSQLVQQHLQTQNISMYAI